MGQTLTQIAEQLRGADKKVQLIYAFNGSGKTRLSREFIELIDPKTEEREDDHRPKVLYYNAFTEDLFYWDNDLSGDIERKLLIHPNDYTHTVFIRNGLEEKVVRTFRSYSNDALTAVLSPDASEVIFSVERGDDQSVGNIKISKGEESNFIWSVFYCLLEQVVETRNIAEMDERETDQFNDLEYIFIDDPVSSLDENNLIQLAVDVAALINNSENENGLKFIITTHSPLFYNVLHNELKLNRRGKREGCRLLERLEDGTFNLDIKHGDANRSFSYHLYLRRVLSEAIDQNKIERFHFMLLRNLYEKTAAFLGYREWGDLLNTVPNVDAPGAKQGYLNRVMQFSSHSSLSSEQVREPTIQEKETIQLLFNNLISNYGYWPKEAPNG